MKSQLKSKLWIPTALAAALFATSAYGASAFTINRFHLYSGPGHDFTRLDTVPENARVQIFGCTVSFGWCDVAWGGSRGWIDGHGLETYYHGRRVIVSDAGPNLDMPVITYSSAYEPVPYEPTPWRYRDDDGDGVRNGIDRFPDDPLRN